MSDHVEEVRRRLEAEYQVEGEIGRGGMAVVYRAIERQHNRPVAIKVMLPELGQALGGERFLREIQLAAGLTQFDVIREKSLYGRKFMGVERSTFLIDANGKLRQEWRKLRVKNHAAEVLAAAKNL